MSNVYGRRDRTARLLKLQILLWQNPNGLKVDEIAQKCSISRKTAYRDLKALETELEIPIWEKGSNRGIIEGYFLPPIHFTKMEAINIFLALRLTERYSLIYNPAVASMFMKLNSVVSQPLQKYVQDALEYMETKPQNERIINNLNKLAEAWLSRHIVKFQYKGVNDKQATERIIEPYFIEPAISGRSSFVVGYCHKRKEVVNYKIDRIIGDITVCPDIYNIPADFNANQHVNSAWSIHTNEELFFVKLRFNQKIKEVITSTIWHSSQKLETQPDESVIMTLTVHDSMDFRAWILGWGGLVEVLEPETLKSEIVNVASSILHIYGMKKESDVLACKDVWGNLSSGAHVDLTDKEWHVIRKLLPPKNISGRPRESDRRLINGVLWKLRSGSGWHKIPRKYGASSTCHDRFQYWQKNNVWQNVLQTIFSNSVLKNT
jgi:predicted DNA-binding transcriptional regulator YafY